MWRLPTRTPGAAGIFTGAGPEDLGSHAGNLHREPRVETQLSRLAPTDYDAKAAEKELKSKAGVRSRWLSRLWLTSQKGNRYLRLDGLVIGISPTRYGRWKYWITEQNSDRRYKTRVWLFFVDGPGGFCKRHGKSYLTRRRRGGEGGGGGSLTGGAVRAAYRWA